MKEQVFLDKLAKIVDDLNNRLVTKEEAVSGLVQLFAEASLPFAHMQNSFAAFIYSTWVTRNLQKRFFAGDRTVISEAKKYEKITDDNIATIMKMPMFSAEVLKKKFEQ